MRKLLLIVGFLFFILIWIIPHKKTSLKYSNGNLEWQRIKLSDSSYQDVRWYASGNKRSVTNFVHDKQNGLEIHFYENGIKKSEKNYLEGRQDGEETMWDSTGKLLGTLIYHGGKIERKN